MNALGETTALVAVASRRSNTVFGCVETAPGTIGSVSRRTPAPDSRLTRTVPAADSVGTTLAPCRRACFPNCSRKKPLFV